MKDKWLNLIVFYGLCFVPIFFMALIYKVYGSTFLFFSAMIYALIYRPIVHIYRCLQLGIIEEKDAWKFFIPFYWTKYFWKVWFG